MAAARFGANENECNGFSLGVHFKDSREATKVQRNLKCGNKRSSTPLWAVCRWLVLRTWLKAPLALRLAGAFQSALGQAGRVHKQKAVSMLRSVTAIQSWRFFNCSGR